MLTCVINFKVDKVDAAGKPLAQALPMPENREPIPVDRVRVYVAQAVETKGLREIARDLELHPSVLAKFLAGANPRPTTRHRLREWVLKRSPRGEDLLDREGAIRMLELLVISVPASDRKAVIAEILLKVREVLEDTGQRVPGWLSEGR